MTAMFWYRAFQRAACLQSKSYTGICTTSHQWHHDADNNNEWAFRAKGSRGHTELLQGRTAGNFRHQGIFSAHRKPPTNSAVCTVYSSHIVTVLSRDVLPFAALTHTKCTNDLLMRVLLACHQIGDQIC